MKQIGFIFEGSPVCRSRITQYFQEFGRRPVEQFIEITKDHDGMIPQRDRFEYFDVDNARLVETSYGPLPFNEGSYIDIFRLQEYIVSFNNDVLIFGSTSEGHHIVFDYENTENVDNPPVSILIHDLYEPNGEFVKYHLSDNFENFMDMLHD